MVWILLIAFLILLVTGPMRRPIILAWRSLVPLILGGIVGHIVVTRFMPGAPPWMTIVGPAMSAFMIGGAISELLATVFPQRRDRDAR